MLEKVLQWAKGEERVRALILTGSRAAAQEPDPLSDYDIALIVEEGILEDEEWLKAIGPVWICVHEQAMGYPTRLAIFENGVKVDFSFLPLKALKEVKWDNFRVLLDKEGISIPKAPLKIPKPTQEEFLNLIEEFWFEAFHVAVYLKRGELWSAQFRMCGIRNGFLLKMIEWSERNWERPIPPLGKRMRSWVRESTWEALQPLFAHPEALEPVIALFQKLAEETAQTLSYPYPSQSKNLLILSRFL